jgi:hypothetical protein
MGNRWFRLLAGLASVVPLAVPAMDAPGPAPGVAELEAKLRHDWDLVQAARERRDTALAGAAEAEGFWDQWAAAEGRLLLAEAALKRAEARAAWNTLGVDADFLDIQKSYLDLAAQTLAGLEEALGSLEAARAPR